MKFTKQQRKTRDITEIYNGTDPLRPLPQYAKSVNTNVSPYGASWNKNFTVNGGTNNVPPCTFDMLKIKDPFNNRKLINEFSKGYFGIYIWTYNPTGVCLVGQSTRKTASGKYSFYTRVSLYFNDNFLSTQLRRSTEFFYYYGFKDISLTLLRIDPNQYKSIDVTKMEQYFIDTLHSELNVVRDVFNPTVTSETLSQKSKLIKAASGKMAPVYFYNKEGDKLLFSFESKAQAQLLAGITSSTIKKAIETGNLYLNYFLITTTPIENATTEFQLTMEEFIKVRNENIKESSYNSSIQKPILCTNILEPSQTFITNSRNKACEKLSKLEGVHIPSKTVFVRLQDGKLYLNKWILSYINISPPATVVTSTFLAPLFLKEENWHFYTHKQ